MDRPLPTFSIEELERYWGEQDKLDRVEAQARLDYALLVRRAMIELSDLLDCPVEKIQGRVEEMIEELNDLRAVVWWSKTRG
jgi:hypothetical protein